jgi:2-dehydro-3-deoxyphosphogluconate aldolase/(4S)-4-hydroxy-2-oxoglutarate aldolase
VFSEELKEKISKSGVIAVLEIDEVNDAVPLAIALLDGGVTMMELTLRTPAALESLIRIKSQVPDMVAGVGTVLTVDQLRKIKDAGAIFGVAPGMNPRIVKASKELKLPFVPGIATPSELEQAVELGCKVLKFFPAEAAGGLNYLKSMAGPYNHLGLKYIPLGGLNLQNAQVYLESPLTLAIGGSWIAKRDIIRKKDWKTITRSARLAMNVVEKVRVK